MPKSKTQKVREASQRAATYAARTVDEQISLVGARRGQSMKEHVKLQVRKNREETLS